jgi:hypothetical protein
MSNKQPEALRLADACETLGNLLLLVPGLDTFKCAAELRRQHALIEEMREALKEANEVFECCGHGKSGGAVMCREALAKAEAQQ